MRRSSLLLSAVPLAVLLAGCSGVPSVLDGQLVAAHHPQCDHGRDLIRYLASGDNQGEPGFDVHYANLVGTLSPAEMRARADDWIEQCDQAADAAQQAADASAAAVVVQQQEVAQAAQEATAAAKVRAQQNTKLSTECAAASGRFDPGLQRCYSTVDGNPSGNPGAACSLNGRPAYLFPVNGSFAAGRDGFARTHPGCWT
jgi:hypothetical protein